MVSVPLRSASEALAEIVGGASEQDAIANAEEFLLQEQVDSGIVLARGDNVTFWHLTLMEYLAALAIAGKADGSQSSILFDDAKVFHPEWQEVVLLYAGILSTQGFDKVSQFLHQLLRVGDTHTHSRFKALGLAGAILRDLRPVGFSYTSPTLLAMAKQCTDLLDQHDISLADRISAGLAIGHIGDARLEKDALEESFVRIPSCVFRRGNERGEPRERPVHSVKLSEYWIACYPVTNHEFKEFVDSGGYYEPHWWGGRQSACWRWRLKERVTAPRYWEDRVWNAPNQPVVGVSWYEAVAYAVWRTTVTQGVTVYRLPTEAEWERAARGPHEDGWVFPWGDALPDPHVNPLANYADAGISKTTPVGIFPATHPTEKENGKVYDLAGNVFEWCLDWFAGRYEQGFHVDPRGPTRGKQRIVKGGSWYRSTRHLRCAYRGHARPGERADTIGFRLVKVISGQSYKQ